LEHLQDVLVLQESINKEKRKSTSELTFGKAGLSDGNGQDTTADEGERKF
jgi:hypothetical protein